MHVISFLKNNFYYPILRVWSNIDFLFTRIIPEFFIRGNKGWAPSDVWSFSYYHAKICKNAIEYLKKHKNGTPISCFPNITESRNYTKKETKIALKKWNKILDTIIFTFSCIIKSIEDNYELWQPNPEKPDEHILSKDYNLIKYHPELKLQTKEEYEKMQKGFQLFVKHYFDLWI